MDYTTTLQEAYVIINKMGIKYANLIPEDEWKFIKNNRNTNYKFDINENVNLSDQKIQKDTMDLLEYFNFYYWCTPEEKKVLEKIYQDNYFKAEKEKRAMYNPNSLFKNNKKHEKRLDLEASKKGNMQLVSYDLNTNPITKFFNKIKQLFNLK